MIFRIAFVALALITLGACSGREIEPSQDEELLEQAAAERDETEPLDSVRVRDDERSVARRIRDATIATEIRLALFDVDELRTFDFDPVVVNGLVLLRGTVLTRSQRFRAAEVAENVEGVRGVANKVVATEEPVIAEAERQPVSQPDGEALPAGSEAEGPPSSQESAEQTATFHTVRSGDNLWEIARRYDVSVDQVQRLNDLSSSSIKPGQTLRIR